jgi:hypothetical protein
MATPRELSEVVSSVTGLPLPTIVDIDRKLAKAGLRTVGGRGFNAARMTPLDAGRLLTAMLGSAHAKEAADTVSRYALARIDKTRSSEDHFDSTGIEELGALPARHSFIEALTVLLTAAGTGSLAIATGANDGRKPRIEVSTSTRTTRARIQIAIPNAPPSIVEYLDASPLNRPGRSKRNHPGPSDPDGDLEQSRRISERTVFEVAKLLAREDE